MKTRIIEELEILSKGDDSKYRSFLMDVLHVDEPQIRKNAKEVLTRILHDYSSFAISTIDSYFQILSRTLAKELNLPVKYEIELDSQRVCAAVSDHLLADAGRVSTTTLWLKDMLLDRLDNNKNWNLRPDLKKISYELLFSEDARDLALKATPELILELIAALKNIRNEVEEYMRSLGTAAVNSIEKAGFNVTDFAYTSGGPVGTFYKIANPRSGSKEFKFGKRIADAVEDPDKLLTKINQKNQRLKDLAHQELHPLLSQALDYYSEKKEAYISSVEVLRMIYLAGITGNLNEKLIAFRDEFQLFLLSDTTRILREVIKDNDAPFIYEKTGNLFKHLFIDEFQDTSNEQWEILRPLVSNSIGSGNDVLLVGDAKQSIYRWRGGNMHLILNGVQQELKRFKELITQENLSTNYRSLGNIVNFNNNFFVKAAVYAGRLENSDPAVFDLAYSEDGVHQAFLPERKDKGIIEFAFFNNPKKKKNKPEDDEENNESDEHWKTKALSYLDKTLDELHARNIALKDIALLVRTNTHEKEIADYLYQGNKFAFISGNSLLISANPACRFLLNCLRILLNDEEPLLHLEISHFLSEVDQQESSKEIPFAKKEILNSKDSWARRQLLTQRNYLLSLPVDLAFVKILELANLTKPDPFIDKFSDLIMEYTGKSGTGISEFLNWWDENVDLKKWSIEIPENTNAIRILSIHRSKGLQFPVVIIPFLDWSFIPNKNEVIWALTENQPFDMLKKVPVKATKALIDSYFAHDYIEECRESYLDNLNLLYVAFTRAEKQLHVFGSSSSPKTNIGNFAMNTLLELPAYQGNVQQDGSYLLKIGESYIEDDLKEATPKKYTLYAPMPLEAITPNYPENIHSEIPSLQTRFDSAQIIFGNQVHEVLNRMRTKTDLKNAVHKISLKYSLFQKPEQIASLTKTVSEVWELMENYGWTNPQLQVESEPEICDKLGQSHRPDRVLIDGTKAIVLDFKTGIADDLHHAQVKGYCALLEKAGYNPVEGHLIYTGEVRAEFVTA